MVPMPTDMKLTHHADGTWSLSGMTDYRVQQLAAALGSQAVRSR